MSFNYSKLGYYIYAAIIFYIAVYGFFKKNLGNCNPTFGNVVTFISIGLISIAVFNVVMMTIDKLRDKLGVFGLLLIIFSTAGVIFILVKFLIEFICII